MYDGKLSWSQKLEHAHLNRSAHFLLTEPALLSVRSLTSGPDLKLVTYTRETGTAWAGAWLLAHGILHSAQGNRVDNGLNSA